MYIYIYIALPNDKSFTDNLTTRTNPKLDFKAITIIFPNTKRLLVRNLKDTMCKAVSSS